MKEIPKLYLIGRKKNKLIEVGDDTPANEAKAIRMADEKRLEWGCKVEVASLGEDEPGRGFIYTTKNIRLGWSKKSD